MLEMSWDSERLSDWLKDTLLVSGGEVAYEYQNLITIFPAFNV